MAGYEKVTFDQVLNAEMKQIHRRRKAAQFETEKSEPKTPVTDDADLNQKHPATMGLAISGGGIRSACIGLGLLQSLYRNHVLRHVDYLSTVSGGGYVGAHLSSFLASSKGKIDWTPGNSKSRKKTKLPFYSEPGAPQTGDVLQMSNRGEVLKQPIKFLSRHLWGWITVNLFVFSGLIALGALAAYLFRMLDKPATVLFLKQLGFMDDVGRALFPAFIMFALWLISISFAEILRQRQLKIPPFSSVMYFLFILTFIMGCVTLLTTKNVETSYFETKWGVSREMGNGIRTVLAWLSQGFLVLFAVGVVPYLNVGAVIRSGTNPRSRLEGWIFNLASSALLFGSPLVVFYILSREDISGWNSRRPAPNTICRTSIADWPEFWQMVGDEPRDPQAQKEVSRDHLLLDSHATPGDVIWKWLSNTTLPADYPPEDRNDSTAASGGDVPNAVKQNAGGRRFAKTSEDAPGKSVVLEESIKNQDRSLWFWERWFQFVAHLVRTDDQFQRRWNDGARLLLWKDAIIVDFNEEVLSDPAFYLSFVEYSPLTETYKRISEPSKTDATPRITIPNHKQPITGGPNANVSSGAASWVLESPSLQLAQESTLKIVLGVASPVQKVSNPQSRGKDDKPIRHKFSNVPEWSGLSADSLNESLVSGEFNPFKDEIPDSILQDVEKRVKAINFLIQHCHREHLAVLDRYEREVAANGVGNSKWKDEWAKIQVIRSSKLSKCWRYFRLKRKNASDAYEKMEKESVVVSPESDATFQPMRIEARNQQKEFEDAMNRIQRLNWHLLRAYFGKQLIYPQSEVFALVVIDQDQELRLWWFVRSGILFVVLGLLFSVNPTMLHGFYRDQLATIWLHPHTRYGTAVPLHKLRNCKLGAPLPLMHGTLNLHGPRRDYELDTVVRFTFSPLHIGAKRVGYCPSDQYMRGNCDLADVLAISGAAVSPIATENMLVRVLLVLFNFRLGQWLHHPSRPPGDLAWPSPLRLLLGYLTVEPALRDYVFVSDGGHTENTGIGALLQRRCRVIIACDSSQGGDSGCADFYKLLMEEKNKYGVRFFMPDGAELSISSADPDPDQKPKVSDDSAKSPDERPKRPDDTLKMFHEKMMLGNKHFIVVRIEYPADDATRRASLSPRPNANEQPGPGANKNPTADVKQLELDRTGYLIYIKPNLTGDESAHLLRFRGDQPAFPHDRTLDQFFESDRFLAYRELGEHMGDDLCEQLFREFRPGSEEDSRLIARDWVPWKVQPLQEDKPVAPFDDAKWQGQFTNENADEVFQSLQHSNLGDRQSWYYYLLERAPNAPADLKSRTAKELLKAIDRECMEYKKHKALDKKCKLDVFSVAGKALLGVGEDHPEAIEKVRSLSEDETQPKKVRNACKELLNPDEATSAIGGRVLAR